MKQKKGEMATLDHVVLGSQSQKGVDDDIESEGYGTSYYDSDDDYSFVELGSDGDVRKKEH